MSVYSVDARDVREIVEYSAVSIAYWRVYYSLLPAGNLHVLGRVRVPGVLQEGSQHLGALRDFIISPTEHAPPPLARRHPSCTAILLHTPPLPEELPRLASPSPTLCQSESGQAPLFASPPPLPPLSPPPLLESTQSTPLLPPFTALSYHLVCAQEVMALASSTSSS